MTAQIARDQLRNLSALPEFVAALAASDEPGLAVGVYADGELAAAATAGCAVVEHGVPVTEQTMFDIASVSKHMTATCLLLLVRDGHLDLDADISASLPELRLSQPVTFRQCLSHTAGLRDYFALCDIAGIGVLGITEDRFMDLVVGQADLDFPPGSAFSYSNTGYALAAVLVRRLTGMSLARFAAERVFGPLGMTATHFRDDVSLLVPGLAAGYVVAPAGQPNGFRRYDVTEEVVGDGAVVTTLTDLAPWHAFMTSGAPLGAEIRDGLLARQVLTDGTRLGYALGLEAIEVRGMEAWWHSGSWAGYRAAAIYLPDLRAGVTVLANRNDHFASHVAFAVASVLTGGGDPAAVYRGLTGEPAPAERSRQEALAIAGLWHEPDQDVFAEFYLPPSEPGPAKLALREHGGDLRYQLGNDGSWHGIGPAGGGTYTLQGSTLIAKSGLFGRPNGRFLRAEPSAHSSPPAAPAGIFFNEELRAHAAIRAGNSGEAEIVIGLAAPRVLIPVGDALWRGIGTGRPGGSAPITVRFAEGHTALLISAPGARRVRFERVTGATAEPDLMRGLRGAK
jgi:CubicO group peptidase (beta-lactamase class C family)